MPEFEPLPWMIDLQNRGKLSKRFSRSGSALEDIFSGRTLGEGGIKTEEQRGIERKAAETSEEEKQQAIFLKTYKELLPPNFPAEVKEQARDLRELKDFYSAWKEREAEKRRSAPKPGRKSKDVYVPLSKRGGADAGGRTPDIGGGGVLRETKTLRGGERVNVISRDGGRTWEEE